MNLRNFVLAFATMLICFLTVAGIQSDQTPEKVARQIAEDWLQLLDSQRYAESWELLSSNTKGKLPKDQWELAMMGMREPLGKLKQRKFEKAQYIKSLQGYPDQEGIIVRFESTFESRKSVIESVGTIHDKDGKWRVVAYVTN